MPSFHLTPHQTPVAPPCRKEADPKKNAKGTPTKGTPTKGTLHYARGGLDPLNDDATASHQCVKPRCPADPAMVGTGVGQCTAAVPSTSTLARARVPGPLFVWFLWGPVRKERNSSMPRKVRCGYPPSSHPRRATSITNSWLWQGTRSAARSPERPVFYQAQPHMWAGWTNLRLLIVNTLAYFLHHP